MPEDFRCGKAAGESHDKVIVNRSETAAKTIRAGKNKSVAASNMIFRGPSCAKINNFRAPKHQRQAARRFGSTQEVASCGGQVPREKTDRGVPNRWKFPALSLRKAGALS
jgi:hypothetical protein